MNLTVSYLFTFIVKKMRFRNIEIVKRNNIKKPSQLTCHIPEAVLNSEGTVYSDWHIPFFSSSFPSLFFFSRFFFMGKRREDDIGRWPLEAEDEFMSARVRKDRISWMLDLGGQELISNYVSFFPSFIAVTKWQRAVTHLPPITCWTTTEKFLILGLPWGRHEPRPQISL